MAKTLEIPRWACYNVDVGCRYPPKMPYMGCILLLMQPTPLTGTATVNSSLQVVGLDKMQPTPLTGTATEHGLPLGDQLHMMQPTPLTGTATIDAQQGIDSYLIDAAHTPHGDGNYTREVSRSIVSTMQPTPLTGTATLIALGLSNPRHDLRCSPHPSRGQYRAKKRGCFQTSTLFLYRTKVSRTHRTLSTPRVWIRF